MTLTFTALLCLGELPRREWVGTPLLPHLVPDGPRTQEVPWGQTFLGERGMSSAQI